MLTKRQKQVLDFITEYSRKKEIVPTIDEIRKHFRLNSVATVHQHLETLRSKGYLDRSKNKTRSLSLSKKRSVSDLMQKSSRSGFALVPLLGSANAGPATIFAEENIEAYQKVPRTIVRKQSGIFAVRVEGDSMNKANIAGESLENGDLAIIDSEYGTPKDGDYVLSVFDDMANLKKFQRDKKTGSVVLLSESKNPKHKPIYVSSEDDFLINGKIIGVIKNN
jgi:SOS regulatory protein LexA